MLVIRNWLVSLKHTRMSFLYKFSRKVYRAVKEKLEKRSLAREIKVRDKIAFFVFHPEVINHFKPVWEHMPEGSFDIILHGGCKLDNEVQNVKACKVFKSGKLLKRNIKYKYMVSTIPLEVGSQPLIKRLATENIRFMYAAGKAKWNFGDWNTLYDAILCYGPYHARIFSEMTKARVFQMGYPRFDFYFNDKTPKETLYKKYNCDSSKKTIVWLPTWENLSTVGLFDDEISELTKDYNVVVKLHPLMEGREPEKVESLKRYEFNCLITDHSNNVPLYQLADYMLFDYGGPPMAGIYSNKKMILLNVSNADQDDLTGKDSPDILLREHIVNVNAEDKKIAELLKQVDIWEDQEQQRKRLRDIYFAPYYGTSARQAANIIMQIRNGLSEHEAA